MSENPFEPPKVRKEHAVLAIDVSGLWDAEAYRREHKKCPCSFFGYPKVLADEERLPRDDQARRYLLAIHNAGVRVGIYESRHTPGEITVACPQEEMGLLMATINDLERRGEFPARFGEDRYEYLCLLANPAGNLVSENPYQPPREVGRTSDSWWWATPEMLWAGFSVLAMIGAVAILAALYWYAASSTSPTSRGEAATEFGNTDRTLISTDHVRRF